MRIFLNSVDYDTERLENVHLSCGLLAQAIALETEVGSFPKERASTSKNNHSSSRGDIMRLTYRGTSYEYTNSPLEARESDVFNQQREAQQRCKTLQENRYPLTYRGVRYTTDQVATAMAMATPRTPQALTYRGVKYIRNVDGTTQFAPAALPAIPNTTLAALREVSRVHQDNLRQNLARRLQAAKARGDQNLVSMLEAESKQLAL
jgi:hypothetical protein